LEDYARKWTKREKDEVDTLSEWVKVVRSLIQILIRTLKCSMSATTTTFVFKDPAVVETMSIIHYKYVVFPADDVTNNIFIICKNITLIAK
jgi:hypothetical protein